MLRPFRPLRLLRFLRSLLLARADVMMPGAASLVALVAVVVHLATPVHAQTIDLSLNVFYNDPGNINSGGTWTLVGKSSHFGIASLSLRLQNIDPAVQFLAPTGRVNGSATTNAGFWVQANTTQGTGQDLHRNITIGQAPLATVPPGNEQRLFYGVGTLTNGAPNYADKPPGSNFIGPLFTTLTNVQPTLWAPVPPGDAFGNSAWNTAASFVSGTFAAGVSPTFFPGTTGQLFSFLPLNNTSTPDNIVTATISTIVRTNFSGTLLGDYNMDGKVDAADYVLWRKNDINGAQGYTDWRNNFGAMAGSGAAAGQAASTAVPEPTSAALLSLVALSMLIIACGKRTAR